MKVLAVCGFGVGSSMILRMTLEKVFKEKGIEVEVENTDLTDARSVPCDAIFTSQGFLEELKDSPVPVYPIKGYTDFEEVSQSVDNLIERKKEKS